MRSLPLIFLLALVACTPYKMDIRQGNFIRPEMRERLKIGMTQAQVRAVLGTPLVNDPFHANRWDYLYRLERGAVVLERQHLTLYFEDGKLARIVEDVAGEGQQ